MLNQIKKKSWKNLETNFEIIKNFKTIFQMFTKKFCILFTKEDKFKIVHVGPFKLMSMLYKFVQAIALIKVSKSIIFRCASFNKYFSQKVIGLQ